VQGEYLDLILEAPFGFEAWRKLCMEFEHLTAGRKLLAIEDLIHPEFGDEMTWRAAWLNWERLVERGASQTGLRLPDDVRIAIVRRRAPDALRQHLQLTANVYEGKYNLFHEAVDSFWKARQGCDDDVVPMDMNLVKTEPKGRSKGVQHDRQQLATHALGKGMKGKGKGLPQRNVVQDADKMKRRCFYCGRKGHLTKECRTGRVCYNCLKPGHTMKNCMAPRRVVQQIEGDYLADGDEEQNVLMLTTNGYKEKDQLKIGGTLKLAVDSGSELHVIPRRLVQDWIERIQNGKNLLLKGAGQEQLKHYGRLRIVLKFGVHTVTSDFEVADVRRAIYSAAVMEEHGWRIVIDAKEKAIVCDQIHIPMTKEGRLYLVVAEVLNVVSMDDTSATTK
jgi:RNase P/RNase MRP subunit p29